MNKYMSPEKINKEKETNPTTSMVDEQKSVLAEAQESVLAEEQKSILGEEQKCQFCSQTELDPNRRLFRFPKPNDNNAKVCEKWAKSCFPHEDWSSRDFHKRLYKENKKMCNLHFSKIAFRADGRGLRDYAIPKEYVSWALDSRRKCCIESCLCSSKTCRMFTFPRNSMIRQIWFDLVTPFCERKTKMISRYHRICIHHFEDKYLNGNVRLPNALPTLFTEKEVEKKEPSTCASELKLLVKPKDGGYESNYYHTTYVGNNKAVNNSIRHFEHDHMSLYQGRIKGLDSNFLLKYTQETKLIINQFKDVHDTTNDVNTLKNQLKRPMEKTNTVNSDKRNEIAGLKNINNENCKNSAQQPQTTHKIKPKNITNTLSPKGNPKSKNLVKRKRKRKNKQVTDHAHNLEKSGKSKVKKVKRKKLNQCLFKNRPEPNKLILNMSKDDVPPQIPPGLLLHLTDCKHSTNDTNSHEAIESIHMDMIKENINLPGISKDVLQRIMKDASNKNIGTDTRTSNGLCIDFNKISIESNCTDRSNSLYAIQGRKIGSTFNQDAIRIEVLTKLENNMFCSQNKKNVSSSDEDLTTSNNIDDWLQTISHCDVYSEATDNQPESVVSCSINSTAATETEEHYLALVKTETGNMSVNQAYEVMNMLQNKVFESALNSSTSIVPVFRGTPTIENGIVILWCNDLNTLIWLQYTVEKLGPGLGANLIVELECGVPPNAYISVPIPASALSMIEILTLLKTQNPWANIDSWVVSNVTHETDDSLVLSFVIPYSKVSDIINRAYALAFGLGTRKISFISWVNNNSTDPVRSTNCS